ncbi:MAG: hypothetical protein R2749_08810 [Acidimicrobiales bacterium]
MAVVAAVMAVLVAIVAVAAPAGADEAPALAPAAVNSLLDCRFGSGQVFDISYTKSGTPGVDRALTVTASAVPGQSAVNPAGPLNGVVAATDYFAFHPSSTHLTTYELRLYDRDGVLKRVVDNTGTFELAGPDVLVYHGGGGTDTLLLTRGVWRYGETGVFAIDQENLINNAALQYTGCTGPWRMPAPDRVTPVSPHRLLDTRDGAALSPSADLSLPVAGHGGVPVTASAVVLNVTVDQPQADGWVAAFPCGATPTTSTINFVRGQTLANLAVVAPGANGAVCFRSTVAGHLVVDLAGYLDAGGEAAYQPLHAARPRHPHHRWAGAGRGVGRRAGGRALRHAEQQRGRAAQRDGHQPGGGGVPHRVPVRRGGAPGVERELRRRADGGQRRAGPLGRGGRGVRPLSGGHRRGDRRQRRLRPHRRRPAHGGHPVPGGRHPHQCTDRGGRRAGGRSGQPAGPAPGDARRRPVERDRGRCRRARVPHRLRL